MSDLLLTTDWMKENFKQFNRDYFDSSLPIPRLSISHSRTQLGCMACKRRGRWGKMTAYDYSIHLSDYYKMDEKEYQNVLLHEMIHYYLAFKGIKDTSPHGGKFREMMTFFNGKHHWNIRVSTRASHLEVNKRGKENKLLIVLSAHVADDKYLLSVVSPRYVPLLERQISQLPQIKSHGWFITNDDCFQNFPRVRSLRGRVVKQEFYEEMIKKMTPLPGISGVRT